MVKFNNFLYNFRNSIYEMFYSSLNKKEEDINYDRIFEKIELISDNEKYYRFFVTVLFLDDYRMKLRYLINNQATEEEKEMLSFYDNNINSVDDIVDYVDGDGDILDMIKSTIIFTRLKDNYQREVLTCSWIKNDYLKKVTPLHVLDLLYYSFPISLDNFVELFNEYNEEENSLDASGEATVEFSQMLLDLYVSDVNNYKTLVDELVETYKIMKYHKIFEDVELDSFVKKQDLDLYNSLYKNSHIRIKLLNYFLEYSILCTKEEQDSFKDEYIKIKKNKR